MSTFMEHIHRDNEHEPCTFQFPDENPHGEEKPLTAWEAAFLVNLPVVEFTEPTEYIDRTLQTASWWDQYVIQPGIYRLEPVTISGHPCDQEHAYYFKARLNAVLTESYRENRLFHHAHADHKDGLNQPTTVVARDYWYRLKTGRIPRLATLRGGRIEYPAGWEENRCDGLPLDQTTCPDKAAHM